MEQFSLEKYLANPSRKVVTRSGRKVRKILCTDRIGSDYPVIALVEFDWGEDTIGYTKDGKYRIGDKSDGDLFFAPEKHEGWANLYKCSDKDHAYYTGGVFNSKAEAENKRDTSDNYVATIKFEWEE